MISNKKGFTLIELLVVIAIIGILSGIVIVSLGTARSKADDSAIKGNLSGLRASAELFRDGTAGNSYGAAGSSATCNTVTTANTVFNDPKVKAAVVAAQVASSGAVECTWDPSNYAIQVPLKTVSTSFFCVDSNGGALVTTIDRIANATDYDCSN